jgi:transcriptional regulator with XRE-family HTH domain
MSDPDDGPSTLPDFLRSRRARLTPEQAGLVSYGPRRVPGLRREELAQLAKVSVTYYTRLEQGRTANVSDSVLDAIARALGLDPDEQAHLRALARPSRRTTPSPVTGEVRASTVRLIDAMADVPSIVLNRRTDVLAWNRAGHALLAEHLPYEAPQSETVRPNLTRLLFLDPTTGSLYPDWPAEALRAVASLHLVAGHYPRDTALHALIGELSAQSPQFAALWAQHPVRNCFTGTKHFSHPRAGSMTLEFDILHVPDDSWQRLLTYHALPGTPSDAALRLLTAVTAHAPRVHRAGYDSNATPFPRAT